MTEQTERAATCLGSGLSPEQAALKSAVHLDGIDAELDGASTDYAAAKWYGAYAGNFSAARRPADIRIRRVIIHVMQGSYSSAINWFLSPQAGVSAHYSVGSAGQVGQSVREKDIAYHAGNWTYNQTTVGIEHEGFVDQPRYFTAAMYESSAKLCADILKRHGLKPRRGVTVIGHFDVPNQVNKHTDPEPNWDWKRYMALVEKHYYGKEQPGGETPFDSGERFAFLSVREKEPRHFELARAAADAIDELTHQGVASYGGDTPGEIAYATRKASEAEFGKYTAVLVGSFAPAYVSPKVSVVGSPDETDIVSTYKVYPSLKTEDALERFLPYFASRLGINEASLVNLYRKKIGKGPVSPGGADTVLGPSLAGITIVLAGGVRRAAKLYSAFNDYRPNAPAQKYHKGEDIECPTGAPQKALTDEVVVYVWDWNTVSGYHQAILTYVPALNIYTLRGHVRAGVSKLWRVGQTIRRGQIVCYGGTYEDAMKTPPHLHYQAAYQKAAALALGVAFNSAAVDPKTHVRAKLREFPAADGAPILEGFDPEAPEHRIELACGDAAA